MAILHKKSGEIYTKTKENIIRRNNRPGFSTDGSEVNNIISSIKQYRTGHNDSKNIHSKKNTAYVLPKDNRNSSVRKSHSRIHTEHNTYIDQSKGLKKSNESKNIYNKSNSYVEKKRYHSSIRTHESFPYDSALNEKNLYKQLLYSGESTGALEQTNEMDPKSVTSQLSELSKIYAEQNYLSSTNNIPANNRITSNTKKTTKPILPKSFSNAAQFPEYMQETTKSSDKTITRSKNGQYFTESILEHTQGGQSVEDMHDYFVALYQKSKKMLKKIEKGAKKSIERENYERNVIPVNESEGENY